MSNTSTKQVFLLKILELELIYWKLNTFLKNKSGIWLEDHNNDSNESEDNSFDDKKI